MNAPSPLGRKVARPRTKQTRKPSLRKSKPVESESTPETTPVASEEQKREPVAPTSEVAHADESEPVQPVASEQPQDIVIQSEPVPEPAKATEVAPQTSPKAQKHPRNTERPHDHNHQRRDRNDRHQRREERHAQNRSQEMGPQTRGLTLLGAKTTVYSDQYTPAILEAFDNRHPENDYFVKFNCPEFTSLCPITGQPDFATIYISYIPDRRMVESKSLKLYLFSFRNHGAFHEDCVNIILKDLIKLMSPRYIEVWGKFLPRGGLSIDPYANYGRPTTRWEEFARQRLLMHDLSPETINNR